MLRACPIQTPQRLYSEMGNARASVAKSGEEIIVGPVFGPSVQEAEEFWETMTKHVNEPDVGMEVIGDKMEGSFSLRFFPIT